MQTSTLAEVLNIDNFIDDKSIVIYQQENVNFLTVKSDFNANLKIYNLVGQLVKDISILDGNTFVDVSQISENIYIVHIKSDKKKITKKIIIK